MTPLVSSVAGYSWYFYLSRGREEPKIGYDARINVVKATYYRPSALDLVAVDGGASCHSARGRGRMLTYLAHLFVILRVALLIVAISLRRSLGVAQCSIRFNLGLSLARRIVEFSLRWGLVFNRCSVRFSLGRSVSPSAQGCLRSPFSFLRGRFVDFSLRWGLGFNRCSSRFHLGRRLARRLTRHIVEFSLRWGFGVNQCSVRFNLGRSVSLSAQGSLRSPFSFFSGRKSRAGGISCGFSACRGVSRPINP